MNKLKYELNSGKTIHRRTLNRYNQGQNKKLSHDQIEEKVIEKQNNMKYVILGFLTQRSLVQTKFMDEYEELIKQVPTFPKLSFVSYRNRINRLLDEGKLVHENLDNKVKYYESSPENILKIAKLIASMKDGRGRGKKH